MDLSIRGKNAIVCASSQGLGKAAAIDLALEGVNLAICSRDQDKIDKTKAEILKRTNNQIKVIALKANLNSSENLSALSIGVLSSVISTGCIYNLSNTH